MTTATLDNIFHNALRGLNNASQQAARAADNIAKAGALRIDDNGEVVGPEPVGPGGTPPPVSPVSSAPNTGPSLVEDLATNIVDLTIAQTLYEANAAVLRTADEMARTLLDTTA